MPKDANQHFEKKSKENYLYFTLPMALNYQRNSYTLWESALRLFYKNKLKYGYRNTFVELYDGDIRRLFDELDNDVDKIRIFIQNQNKKKYPYLSRTKICNYWLYVIWQYTDKEYKNIENLTVASDNHIVKATHRLELISDEELDKSDVQLIVIDRCNELFKDTKYKPIDIHSIIVI